MAKFIISLLVLTILVLSAVLLVKDDPGFVLIQYADHSLETSLAFGIVAIAVIAIVVQVLLKFLLSFLRLPKTFKRQAEKRRKDKSRKLLNQGLIDLAEGRFSQSEGKLVKLIEHAENPLLNYLAAARAAQQQGNYDQRDNYLKAAHEAKPEAEIAIGVTQSDLQLASGQTERALATLMNLRSLAPKHDYVLKLLARVYSQIGEWELLAELLPEVRSKKLFKEDKLEELESNAFKGCLNKAAIAENDMLDKTWSKIPKYNQSQIELILHYISLVNQYRLDSSLVVSVVVKSINNHWDTRLVEQYGKLTSINATEQLTTAEKWLQDYGTSDVLLLTLGRICIHLQLWGKAQNYIEASIGIRPSAESCLELANLLSRDELGKSDDATKYFKQGLELCLRD